jgi:Etoposide-induced protein 2.4 (EI24)
MYLFLDSFWRAAAYCVRPRVIVLSILPLLIMVGLTMVLGYFFWDAALDQVRVWVESFPYLDSVWQWLESMGFGRLKAVLVPLLVVFCVTPFIVVVSMLAVALLMTPALVNLVAANRFAGLEVKSGGSVASSLVWSLGSTLLAGLAMLVSVPLWLLPPLVLLIPPLIWGWLTYRVMAFDALATHASTDERRALFKQHGAWLLLMGVICGYLGASPSAIWAMGAGFAPAFLFLVPVAVWVYTLVFAFASLWFIHYCLGALSAMRLPAGAGDVVDTPVPEMPISLPRKDEQ